MPPKDNSSNIYTTNASYTSSNANTSSILSNSSTTTTTNIGPYTTTTSYPIVTSGYFSYDNDLSIIDPLINIVFLLSEQDLKDVLEKIKPICIEGQFEDIIRSIIRERHCSEEFLLAFMNSSLTKQDLFRMHKADILSGAYPSIKLYLNIK